MFDLEHAIAKWRKQMLAAGIKSPVPLQELESHLRDHIDRLKSGLSEEEAFQTAAKELGDGELLKKEFSKGRLLRRLRNNNPTALNILAVWFVLMGVEDPSHIARVLYFSVEWWPVFHLGNLNWLLNRYIGFSILHSCLLIFIGWGLFRRQNGWRITAVIMLIYKICMETMFLRDVYSHYEKWSSAGYYPSSLFYLIGLRFPFASIYFFTFLNVGLSFWAVYLLTKSRTRNLFRPAAAN